MNDCLNIDFFIAQTKYDLNIEKFNSDFFLEHENYLARFDSSSTELLIPFILIGNRGETTLTIPGLNERDFAFYFYKEANWKSLFEYLKNIIKDEKPTVVRIPLVNYESGLLLVNLLNQDIFNYEFYLNISNHVPIINKKKEDYKVSKSLKRISNQKGGKYLIQSEVSQENILKTIMKYHNNRWGSNRSGKFFYYIEELTKQSFVKTIAIKSQNKLEALQLNIQSFDTLHYYYAVCNDLKKASIGTMALSVSYFDFFENEDLKYFSFGRGAEEYKFRYANSYIKLYEIRGIYSP